MGLALTLLALLMAGAVALRLRPVRRVSRGRPIPTTGRRGSALILVHLQPDWVQRGPYPPEERDAVLARIDALTDAAQVAGRPVIALRHGWHDPVLRGLAHGFLRGRGLPGTAGTALMPPADAADHILDTSLRDGFADGTLDMLLDYLGVATLEIAGAEAMTAVACTALAARQRGYAVTVHEDAILGRARRRWPALRARLARQGIAFVGGA